MSNKSAMGSFLAVSLGILLYSVYNNYGLGVRDTKIETEFTYCGQKSRIFRRDTKFAPDVFFAEIGDSIRADSIKLTDDTGRKIEVSKHNYCVDNKCYGFNP